MKQHIFRKEDNLQRLRETNYSKSFEDVRVMETLMISTIWDSSNADPEAKKLPKKIRIGNMFTSTNLTKEQVKGNLHQHTEIL